MRETGQPASPRRGLLGRAQVGPYESRVDGWRWAGGENGYTCYRSAMGIWNTMASGPLSANSPTADGVSTTRSRSGSRDQKRGALARLGPDC